MRMKGRYALAILAALALAVCMIPADTDGATIDNSQRTFEFDNLNGGTIWFIVDNSSGSSFEMTVTVTEGSKTVATQSYSVPAGDSSYRVEVSMPGFTSEGTHTLTVSCTTDPSGQFTTSSFNVTVNVEKNILSNWALYLVIAVIVIVIAIFAYLKIRDTPKNKPEMTFEQLEALRKQEMAEKSQKKQKSSTGPSTERKRYLESKKKGKE